MAKILVIDVDQVHCKKLETVLSGLPKTQIVVLDKIEPAIDILNALPSLAAKKAEFDKVILEGENMVKKTIEVRDNSQKLLVANEQQLAAMASKETPEAMKLQADIQEAKTQLAKAAELLPRLEGFVVTKKAELEAVIAKEPKPEDKKCSLVLVDRAFLGTKPGEWVQELQKKIQLPDNKNVPIVVMGYNEDVDYIRQTLVPGVFDYLVKPADVLLLKYNIPKWTGQKQSSEDKVYELEGKSEIKIVQIVPIKKMSEFEILIAIDRNITGGEFVELNADSFGGGKTGGRLLARCSKCEADPGQKGRFLAQLSFVGMSPHAMNEMRRWLKQQYVAAKAASGS